MEQPQFHPLPGPPHPQREGFLSYIPSKPPFFQFQTAPPCPSPTCPGKLARGKLRGHTGSILVSPSNNLAVKIHFFSRKTCSVLPQPFSAPVLSVFYGEANSLSFPGSMQDFSVAVTASLQQVCQQEFLQTPLLLPKLSGEEIVSRRGKNNETTRG